LLCDVVEYYYHLCQSFKLWQRWGNQNTDVRFFLSIFEPVGILNIVRAWCSTAWRIVDPFRRFSQRKRAWTNNDPWALQKRFLLSEWPIRETMKIVNLRRFENGED
jgi:hypothetical protein